MTHKGAQGSEPMSTFVWNPERRQAPRVDLLVELKGQLMALNEAAKILQISLRGMTVETTIPLSSKITHEFRFKLDSHTLTLKTRVAHSRMAVNHDEVTHVAGLEFLDLTPADAEQIGNYIDRLLVSQPAGADSGQ
jgi:c-di-GMP-binding flagellar brake protein YcgR